MRCLLLILLAIPAFAQGRLYVADSGEDRVSIVDTQARKVTGEIRVPANPGAMAASEDGLRLYVVSSTRNAVDAIDVKTGRVVRSISTGPLPAGIAVSSDGRRAFVCLAGGDGIEVFDTASFARIKTIPAGKSMRNIYLTPDQTRMIATSTGDKKLVVINARTEQVEFEIPVSGVPGQVAIDSDRNLVIDRIFVQVPGGIEVIDYRARKATSKIALAGAASGGGFGITPDRKALWADGAIFSLPDLKRVGAYTGGDVAFASGGRRAFVSNPDADSVSVIDITTLKELARIPVGKKPGAIVVLQ
ncbi:MAG TPA: hypothetical protein VG273_09630 [Bryobacteraceae bacterium]|jgi:YVTN family beta-propeller protein|nr:hypothetical protein [Bryobacteraceae bacterium]